MDAAFSFLRCSPKLANKTRQRRRRLPSVRRVLTVSEDRTGLRRKSGGKASHSRPDSSGNSVPNQSAGGGAARQQTHANEHLRPEGCGHRPGRKIQVLAKSALLSSSQMEPPTLLMHKRLNQLHTDTNKCSKPI